MIKSIILNTFFLFLFGVASVYGQGHNGLYGNEWIDYTPGKEYYKIKVFEDGSTFKRIATNATRYIC